MRYRKCRVCGADIRMGRGWASHVGMHKRAYCVKYCLPKENSNLIYWEAVVQDAKGGGLLRYG